eukprot:5477916-Amphidinium_carterae.1
MSLSVDWRVSCMWVWGTQIFASGSYGLNVMCYATLAYSYSALLAQSTAKMQNAVAVKMLGMGAEDRANESRTIINPRRQTRTLKKWR